jgi:hypothetical protein
MLKYKKVYYWKKSLKTAVEYVYQNNDVIQERISMKTEILSNSWTALLIFIPKKNLKTVKNFITSHREAVLQKNHLISNTEVILCLRSTWNLSAILFFTGNSPFFRNESCGTVV